MSHLVVVRESWHDLRDVWIHPELFFEHNSCDHRLHIQPLYVLHKVYRHCPSAKNSGSKENLLVAWVSYTNCKGPDLGNRINYRGRARPTAISGYLGRNIAVQVKSSRYFALFISRPVSFSC